MDAARRRASLERWAVGFGGSQTTDANIPVGSNNTTSSIYDMAVGANYRLLAEYACARGRYLGGAYLTVGRTSPPIALPASPGPTWCAQGSIPMLDRVPTYSQSIATRGR
jgi:hypothetical protein